MRKLPRLLWSAVFAATTLLASGAYAQDDQHKEAGVHFQRAVQLYSEADYRAALVEFKKAYELQPHVTVLYNLGQTYYQLQNYAEALTAFERFLAEGGTAHRSEVEQAVTVLKTRVGKIDVTTSTPGWDISVDDDSAGKTPLPKPIAVSIGKHKITATKAGEAPQSKAVEVAAGETSTIALSGNAQQNAPSRTDISTDTTAPKESHTSGLLIAGWIGTGALTAGAVVTGILAAGAAGDLDDARNNSPASRRDLDDKGSKTTTLAVVTDVLAASAIVLGGITLYFTLAKPSSKSAAQLKPGKFVLGGTF